jgi:hypothetical protein
MKVDSRMWGIEEEAGDGDLSQAQKRNEGGEEWGSAVVNVHGYVHSH